MKQIINVIIWTALASICLTLSEGPPKECAFGTPDYNATLCNETCTKDNHKNETYCKNITAATVNEVQTVVPQNPTVDPVEPLTPENVTQNVTEMIPSSAPAHSSVVFSFLVSLFLYKIFT